MIKYIFVNVNLPKSILPSRKTLLFYFIEMHIPRYLVDRYKISLYKMFDINTEKISRRETNTAEEM